MRLIIDRQEKQKEKNIFDALEYMECVIEYLDNEVDIEKVLIVRDSDLKNIIVFWRSSVYAYSLCGELSIQEIYEQITDDFVMEKIVDIYPVSPTITFERLKK